VLLVEKEKLKLEKVNFFITDCYLDFVRLVRCALFLGKAARMGNFSTEGLLTITLVLQICSFSRIYAQRIEKPNLIDLVFGNIKL
jgi:hypothetical protein